MTEPAIKAVAALDDELRRGMYTFIRAAGRPVTRDEAAEAVGISRKLAAFHLDKLVDAGVLQASYQRAGVRKVGRAPKVYQPVEADIRVSIPPRQPDLLAEILLDAVLADGPLTDGRPAGGPLPSGPLAGGPLPGGSNARQAALRAARDRGHDIGAAEREQTRPGRLGVERALTVAVALMRRHGFEPSRESPTCVRLRTCPFHPLAAKAPEMVCGINHAFLSGMLDGLNATPLDAALDPRAGECCVELHPRPTP